MQSSLTGVPSHYRPCEIRGLPGFLGRLGCTSAERTADLVPLSPQTRTSASSSPCCALLMTSVTGCARRTGRRAPGPAASATLAKGSCAPFSRRRRSPTLRACCCARARPPTRVAGSAGATPSPPAAHCHRRPPTAWSCGTYACPTRCAGAGCWVRADGVDTTPSAPPSWAGLGLNHPPPPPPPARHHEPTLPCSYPGYFLKLFYKKIK